MSKEDKFIIDSVAVTKIGENIVDLQQHGELVPKNCPCENKDVESCKRWCIRIGSLATVIAGFIPNLGLKLSVLTALVEFQFECYDCCEKGLGNEDCFKNLKLIISTINNGIKNVGTGMMDEMI